MEFSGKKPVRATAHLLNRQIRNPIQRIFEVMGARLSPAAAD
jgi:hypothetical protein